MFIRVNVSLSTCMESTCMPGTERAEVGVSELQKLELYIMLSFPVDPGTQTSVFSKKKFSLPLTDLSIYTGHRLYIFNMRN